MNPRRPLFWLSQSSFVRCCIFADGCESLSSARVMVEIKDRSEGDEERYEKIVEVKAE